MIKSIFIWVFLISKQINKNIILRIQLQKIYNKMRSNYHANQILYVRDIGYARVAMANEKSPKVIQQPNVSIIPTTNEQLNNQQSEQTLFDPDMFNIQDPNYGESVDDPIELSTRKLSVESSSRRTLSDSKILKQSSVIIPMKLQNTNNVMIYCPQSHLMKKISLTVKSLLQNHKRKQITINIQIIKTIDNLKNLIFKELGQEIGYFSDIRIFSMTIVGFNDLAELNMGSKTIWQYNLKDKSKINILAKFNFTFKALLQCKKQLFSLTNSNSTISNFIVQAKKEQPAIQPVVVPIVPTIVPTPVTQQQSPIKPQVQKVQVLPPIQPVISSPQKVKQKQFQKLHLECNIKIRSGIHYWEFKIDRLNVLKNQESKLVFGICLKNQLNMDNNKNAFQSLWGYDAIRSKKIQIININQTDSTQSNHEPVTLQPVNRQQVNQSVNQSNHQNHQNKQNQKNHQSVNDLNRQNPAQDDISLEDSSDQQYGSVCRTGDTVGVLLSIKEKHVSLIFYKNSVCLDQCFEFKAHKLRQRNANKQISYYMCPYVNVKGDFQISLDSKATPPLDSYRFQ